MLMQNKIHTLLLLILTLWIAVGCADVVETKNQFSEVNDGDWVQFLLEDEETNRLNSPDTQGGIYPNEPVGTMRSRWVVNQTPSAITFRYINTQLKYPNNYVDETIEKDQIIHISVDEEMTEFAPMPPFKKKK